jgi:hypothetical protein
MKTSAEIAKIVNGLNLSACRQVHDRIDEEQPGMVLSGLRALVQDHPDCELGGLVYLMRRRIATPDAPEGALILLAMALRWIQEGENSTSFSLK